MKCEPISIPGGVGFLCSRGARRKACSVCKRRKATKLCDFPLTGGKAGKTCDRDLCGTCAQNMGEVIRLSADPRWESHRLRMAHGPDTVDFCPAHAAEVKRATQGFPVTDPDLDAPDGAIVDGFERSGDRWRPVRRPPLNLQASLDFQPPTRKDPTK